MSGRMCVAELFAKSFECSGVLIVTIDISQQARELFERNNVDSAVFLEALPGTRAKPIEVPSGLGYTDHRYVQVSAFHHCLQRREDLLVSKVARSTEENERVRMGVGHRYPFLKQPPIFLRLSPSARRTRNAWQTGVCPRSLLHPVS